MIERKHDFWIAFIEEQFRIWEEVKDYAERNGQTKEQFLGYAINREFARVVKKLKTEVNEMVEVVDNAIEILEE